MSNADQSQSPAVVMDADAIAAAVDQLAQAIADDHPDVAAMVLLGILRRGRPLADRLAARIGEIKGAAAPRVGSLATTLYRDDLRTGVMPGKVSLAETHFDFNVDGVTVIIVDDVIAAGRTIRAALDEIMDYGRPTRIRLACLVDRGLRELPIQPDYCGLAIPSEPDDYVAVRLAEADGEDAVHLVRGGRTRQASDA